MSSKTEQKEATEKEGRVSVDDLPQPEVELSDEEARRVRGNGGALGGVVNRRPIGEEIPTAMRQPGAGDPLAGGAEDSTMKRAGGKAGLTGDVKF